MTTSQLQSLKARIGPINMRDSFRNYLLLTLGAAIMIINFNLFIAPGDVAPGGISGLSLIINKYTGIPYGTGMLLLSIPLIAIGFWQLGRFRFLVRTLYVTLFYTLGVDLTARFFPPEGIIDDLLLTAVFGGILGGIGYGIVLRGRGMLSGTGIISRVIQLRTGLPLSQLYIVVDSVIIIGLGLAFSWENALYAMLMLFMLGLATDYIMEGPSVVRVVFIVTDYPVEVGAMMMSRFKIGVTRWQGEGMYTNKEHAILFCTVTRPDVETLRDAVMAIDPQAFVAVGQGHQAWGGVVKPSDLAAQAQEAMATQSATEVREAA